MSEGDLAALRQPGRHVAFADDLGDLFGALPDIRIREQTERRGLARAMASGAMLEHDRSDVAVEGQGLGRPRVEAEHEREDGRKEQCQAVRLHSRET